MFLLIKVSRVIRWLAMNVFSALVTSYNQLFVVADFPTLHLTLFFSFTILPILFFSFRLNFIYVDDLKLFYFWYIHYFYISLDSVFDRANNQKKICFFTDLSSNTFTKKKCVAMFCFIACGFFKKKKKKKNRFRILIFAMEMHRFMRTRGN